MGSNTDCLQDLTYRPSYTMYIDIVGRGTNMPRGTRDPDGHGRLPGATCLVKGGGEPLSELDAACAYTGAGRSMKLLLLLLLLLYLT